MDESLIIFDAWSFINDPLRLFSVMIGKSVEESARSITSVERGENLS